MTPFEWSESGLQLLETIHAKIAQYGGVMKLVDRIECEQVKMNWHTLPVIKPPKKHGHLSNYTEYEEKYIKANFKKQTSIAIGEYLDRTPGSIRAHIWLLRKMGKIPKYKLLNVSEVRNELENGTETKQVAKQFGVHPFTIDRIKRGCYLSKSA